MIIHLENGETIEREFGSQLNGLRWVNISISSKETFVQDILRPEYDHKYWKYIFKHRSSRGVQRMA